MPVEKANRNTRKTASDILARFLTNYNSSDELLGKVRSEFKFDEITAQILKGELSERNDVSWRDQGRFVFLERIEEEGILPLVTLQSSDDWVHFRIYVLLTLWMTNHLFSLWHSDSRLMKGLGLIKRIASKEAILACMTSATRNSAMKSMVLQRKVE